MPLFCDAYVQLLNLEWLSVSFSQVNDLLAAKEFLSRRAAHVQRLTRRSPLLTNSAKKVVRFDSFMGIRQLD